MIVDTQLHYIQPDSPERPHDPLGAKSEPVLVETVIAEASALGIDRIVQLSPSCMKYDNTYGIEGAILYPDKVAGIFGRLNPIGDDHARRLREFMGLNGMLGVRVQIVREGEAWLRKRVLDDFFAAAEQLNIAISIPAPRQPRELADLARRFPGLRLISEHLTLSNTGGAEGAFDQWKDVLAMASLPNVWSKVSYFPEAAPRGESFPFPTAQRYLKELYEREGPERMIWGSNYNSVTNTCSYRQAFEFMHDACDFIPTSDRDAIMGDTFLAKFGCPSPARSG